MSDHHHLTTCVSRLVRPDGTRADCDCGTTPRLMRLKDEGSLPAYVGFIRAFLEELHKDAALMLERDAMRNRIDRVTMALDCVEDALARIQATSFAAQEDMAREAQEAGEAQEAPVEEAPGRPYRPEDDLGPPLPGESFLQFQARCKRAEDGGESFAQFQERYEREQQQAAEDKGVGPRPLPPQGDRGA